MILRVEAKLVCPNCDGCPYILYRRSSKENPEIMENVLWPTASAVLPPEDKHLIECPKCKVELKRRSD